MSEIAINSEAPRTLRAHLQSELVRRIQENPRYSLRAFARFLKVDSSLLSKILSGKRNISRALHLQIVDRLALPPSQVALFQADETGTNLWMRPSASEGKLRALSLDQFQIVSDWYHYAIFELMLVKSFRANTRWMARALGIAEEQVATALRRMERAGMVSRGVNGWTRSPLGLTNLGPDITPAPFRLLQKQILEKAIRAVDDIPLERRDQSSMTMAINAKDLPEAREIIRRFRRDLTTFLQRGKEATDVYHLSVSLYPVTQIEELQ